MEDVQTPERAFAESLRKDVVYMGLSDGEQLRQQPPSTEPYTEPLGTLLCFKIAAECFITTEGTWGGVSPHADAEENVSLALWVCEMCRRCNINVRIETLTNAESAQSKLARVSCYRVWVNVPSHKKLDFAKTCQAHLSGLELPTDGNKGDDAEDNAGKKGGKKKQAKQKKAKLGKHAVTYKLIQNQEVLKRVVNRMYMCSRDSMIKKLNWDAITADEGEAGQAIMDEQPTGATDMGTDVNMSTLFTLLSAQRHFSMSNVQHEYADSGVAAYAMQLSSYVKDLDTTEPKFCVPSEVYAHFSWTFRDVSCYSQCFVPDSDNFKAYLLPNNDVPLDVLAKRFDQGVQRFNGASRKRRYLQQSKDEIKALFVGRDAPHRNYSQIIEIRVPHPVGQVKGVKYNDLWLAQIYPVGYKKSVENRKAQSAVIDQVKRRRLDSSHLKKIHERISDDSDGLLTSKCLGTVPTYRLIDDDFWRLHYIVHPQNEDDDNEDAKMMRVFMYYNENSKQTADNVPLFDQGFMSIMDGITNYNNVTQQQLIIVIICLVMMWGSAINEFGMTAMAMALVGRSDVGKSFAVRVVTGMLPPSMQESENDTSDKAWVLDGHIPFRMLWKDEMNVGTVDVKGRNTGKDPKVMQAGMSNGVQTYKQYQRGKDGEPDTLGVYNIDCRKVPVITSNQMMTEAMESRFFGVPTFDEKKNAKGRTKTEKAACDVQNSIAADNFQAFMQYFMASSFFAWHIRSNGAYIARIDTTLYEVMTGLQSRICPSATKCRNQDRIKQLARSLMNMKAMNELVRVRENYSILTNCMRRDAFLKIRCAVVPMRCFEIALHLTRPSKAFAAATTRAKIATKKLILHDFMTMEPVVDKSGHYYVTDVPKQDCTVKLFNSCESQNLETNAEILAQAIQTLECKTVEGLICVKFEGNFEKLHILKSVIDTAQDGIDSVLTIGEVGLIEWLIHIKQTTPEGILWRYSYNEKNVVFDTCVRDVLIDEQAQFNSNPRLDRRPAQLKIVRPKLALNVDVRKMSYLWLCRNVVDMPDGNPQFLFQVNAANEPPHEGMMIIDKDDDPALYAVAVATKPNGPHPNKRKRPVVMPGGIAVSRQYLRDFLCPSERANAEDEKLRDLGDVLMAVSGEAKVGDRLFRNISTEADTDVASAITSKVRAPKKRSWVYDNPRRFAKTNVMDTDAHFKYDTMHPENQKTITVRSGDNLYYKRCQEACIVNTGMELQDWEAMWSLPPMFNYDEM